MVAAIANGVRQQGFAVVRGLLPADLVAGLHDEYLARYGALSREEMQATARRGGANPVLEVGTHRYEISVRVTGRFRDPRVFASGTILPIVSALLDGYCQLSSYTLVASHPGAPWQHVHRDYHHLFADQGVAVRLPPFAINVIVPLCDVDRGTGPTAIWSGSHRWPEGRPTSPQGAVGPETRRGDVVLMDYRTLHAGMPNASDVVRPTLYLVYARPWFFDETNHRQRRPIDMSIDPGEPMAPEVAELLSRVFQENARWRIASTNDPDRG
jgi:ectoine hydroxylase-related dioxygenase (phytanoyl-CoA dioxygenase family)